jgi:hypothetical protein
MNADGSGLRRLVRDAFGPAWSPQGLIAHFRGRAGETADLWTMRPDGSDARLRVRGAFYRGSHSLVWSPAGSSLLFLRRPNARGYYPGIEYSVGDVVRLQLAQHRTRVVARRAIPLAWLSDGRLLVLRPRTIAGELVFAVVTLAQDGRDERVVGVTDEEDVNIGSFPAWQPRRAPLRTALAPFDPRPEWQYCLDRLRRLRASLG